MDTKEQMELERRIARLETDMATWQQTWKVIKCGYTVAAAFAATVYVVLQSLRAIGWLVW